MEISSLECKQPIVFWSDATFAGLVNFYKDYTNLNKSSIIYGNKLEQSAYDRSKLIIFSSDWAVQTALENYNVDKNKIHVVPFGANIETELTYDEMKTIVQSRKNDILKILKNIYPILKLKYGINELALFGSYAKGNATSESDIDILINSDSTLSLEVEGEIQLIFENIFPGTRVDLTLKNNLHNAFRKEIKESKINVTERL